MNGQALDLKRSAQIVRRHKILVAAAFALGLIAGAAYTALEPPSYTSSALVAVTPAISIASQPVVVTSTPVLLLALPSVSPGLSLTTLRGRVQAQRVATGLMSVSATGNTPAQAVGTANAVARSYVSYVTSANYVTGPLPAEVFQPATSATGTSLRLRLSYAGGTGAAAGVLIGAIIALAIGHNDRRLRTRDEIADSIGVPVLASVSGRHPAKTADWTKLLDRYEPEAGDALRLRKVLGQLGVVDPDGAGVAGNDLRLSVLSLARDRRALALGPQLAAFAATLGIPAALVVGPQQDPETTAVLRAACAAVPERPMRPGELRVVVSEDGDASLLPKADLTLVIGVVDGQAPRVANTMRATTTVLSVTSGAVTAQQLARVAASAAGDGRVIAGILLTDPDPADQTTGRIPQLARPGQQRMLTRMTGAVTEVLR